MGQSKYGVQQITNTVELCSRLIVGSEDRDSAEKKFADWLVSDDAEEVVAQRIGKIVGAPMLNDLLAESGQRPINWETINDEAQAACSAEMENDDFEQGFWADVNQIVPPHFNVDSLLQNLPDDIRSGLNWSADKKFYFLLSVLGSNPDTNSTPDFEDSAEMPEDDPEKDLVQLNDGPVNFPELVSRELSVLIEARNAVVAACLWRKHAVNTPLADNAIRIDPWCGMIC